MKILYTLFFSILCSGIFAQFLADMPEPVSNNAVTGAYVNGIRHVYSFSGIDSTKKWNGIHKKAFRYNVDTDVWDTIPDLPSGTGRIAAAASTVKNKIYIIGGYEVFSNGSERSLNEVHIFNPETNEYEANGEPIPIPIDDHVQAVYKDSLIFCVTGWSQNTNVPNVQIYDPSKNEWLEGTSVPNNGRYKVFGASGAIVGDTLYYLGGARIGTNFPASNQLRKGYINPIDPTDIIWSSSADPLAIAYRAVCTGGQYTKPNWYGGSLTTYNYDGIAYDGSGGVVPSGRTIYYSNNGQLVSGTQNSFPDYMDMRGAACFDCSVLADIFFCGGMGPNQEVSKKTFALYSHVPTENKEIDFEIEVFPNPTSNLITIKADGNFDLHISTLKGKSISKEEFSFQKEINLKNHLPGIYTFSFFKNGNLVHSKKVIKK